MFPYEIPKYSHDWLRGYKGFEDMSDELLNKAMDVLYTITFAYLNSKEIIEEYERKKAREG